MGAKIKGLNKFKKDFKRALIEVPEIAAVEYKKRIVKNLKPSKKTGALSNSFKIRTTLKKATISSDLPYSLIQNYGGKIRITDRMRKKMWALYKEFKLAVFKAIAITKKTSIVIPAKNYIDININSFMKVVDKKFQKVLNKKTNKKYK